MNNENIDLPNNMEDKQIYITFTFTQRKNSYR